MKLAQDGAISLIPYGLGKMTKAGIKALPKGTLGKIWTQYCRDNPLVTKMINRFAKDPAAEKVVRAAENKVNKVGKKVGKSPEFYGGQLTEKQFLNCVEKFLGKNYNSFSNGRYVSKDGLRQVRYGQHEVTSKLHHGHFEAYDVPGGRIV